VVEGGVDEDAAVVPSGGLDSDRLVERAAELEGLVSNFDG
jgi:hypothetical protein